MCALSLYFKQSSFILGILEIDSLDSFYIKWIFDGL